MKVKRFQELNSENKEKTKVIFKNKDMVVFVPTVYDGWCKYMKNTEFCSNDEHTFINHNDLSNMYRIFYKDGNILRLTWDLEGSKATWGLGGKGNKYVVYTHFGDPFKVISSNGNDEYDSKMFSLIESLPKEVIKAIRDFQYDSDFSKYKLNKLGNLNSIRIEETDKFINALKRSDLSIDKIEKLNKNNYIIIVKYNNEYILVEYELDKNLLSFNLNDFNIHYNMYLNMNAIKSYIEKFIMEEFEKKMGS